MKFIKKGDYIDIVFGKEDTIKNVFADIPKLDMLHHILFGITDNYLKTFTKEEKAEMAEDLVKERIYCAIPKL